MHLSARRQDQRRGRLPTTPSCTTEAEIGTTFQGFDNSRKKISYVILIYWVNRSKLVLNVICTHRCRRGRRFVLSSQQKFQQNMKICCKGIHKIHKWKYSTEGPTLVILGFLAIFGKNMVKNQFYGSFNSDSSYWCKIWWESQILVNCIVYFRK